VGTDLIAAGEEQLWRHVLRQWAGHPGIEVLGSPTAARLPIISFRIRHGAQYLHHNFVVALLNGLFGIQTRGGCSCAGPYGHQLLAIGPARSHALRAEIGHGCDGVKPGWTRGNLNYFISEATAGYIAAAVELIAADGYRLLPDYRFDPRTGLWRHAARPPRPPITLADVGYGLDGEMTYPRHRGQASEEAFPGYLSQARAILAARPAHLDQGPTGLPPEFEALRWFPLPPACLQSPCAGQEVGLDLVKAGQHLRIDVDHGASQAGLTEMILVAYPDSCGLRVAGCGESRCSPTVTGKNLGLPWFWACRRGWGRPFQSWMVW
jgi:hypothetical protein